MLTDNIKMKELSSLKEEIEHLDESYNYIFTDEALKRLVNIFYIGKKNFVAWKLITLRLPL